VKLALGAEPSTVFSLFRNCRMVAEKMAYFGSRNIRGVFVRTWIAFDFKAEGRGAERQQPS